MTPQEAASVFKNPAISKSRSSRVEISKSATPSPTASPTPPPAPAAPVSLGDKRLYSTVSPPLLAIDNAKKSNSVASTPPQQQQPFHQPAEVDLTFASAPTSLPPAPPPPQQHSPTMDAFMAEVRSRLDNLELALNEISRLKQALEESETARSLLEAKLASLTTSTTTTNTTSRTPSPSSGEDGKTALSYAAVAAPAIDVPSAAAPPPPTLPTKRKKIAPPTPKRATTIASRLFAAPKTDTPSGYQFLYYQNSTRRPLQELRRVFQALGLNNARILDIQYPVASVLSLLVHNDYATTVSDVMFKITKCRPLSDFDPYDVKHLKDPKFEALSPAAKQAKAREIENLRCLRAVSFVRRSVRVALARSFLEKERINQKQFESILKEELAARASVSPPKPNPSSDAVRLAKKQRLRYLSYLLHHDEEQARLLASADSSSALGPSSEGQDASDPTGLAPDADTTMSG